MFQLAQNAASAKTYSVMTLLILLIGSTNRKNAVAVKAQQAGI